MKVTILGGGNGGHATAAELTLTGHEVTLCEHPEFEESILAAQALGGITLSGPTANGVEGGFATVHLITTDVGRAIKDAQVVIFVMDANGHRSFIEAIEPSITDGQIILFSPGYFGALECAAYLKQRHNQADVVLAETSSLIYGARISGPAKVDILGVKRELGFAAFPASRTEQALATVGKLYPQFVPQTSVLATSLNNINYINHPASVLLNASRIEQIGPYRSRYYDVTPSVARVMSSVDEERMTIASALGLEGVDAPTMLKKYYGSRGESIYEAIHSSYIYESLMSPPGLQHRYVTEDVPYGLVPIASLGRQIGVRAKAIEALIDLACIMNGEDYWATGRTAERLGIEGMDADRIREYVS